MDQQAATLLATLRRPSASPESKLTLLNSLKSDIKHYRVPLTAQRAIFDCLRLAISQQTSSSVVTAAFSTLGHLIKRLAIQEPEGKTVAELVPDLLPVLSERLCDQRDGHRLGASQALSDVWPYCPAEVERTIRQDAIDGPHPRAKETAMQWVVKMHQECDLHFKNFVPSIVACLEQADGGVRDTAKAAIVDLFRGATAKTMIDLNKQLSLHNVRPSITSQILSQLGQPPIALPPHAPVDLTASVRSTTDNASTFKDSVSGNAARPQLHQTQSEEVTIDPVFVHSQRELEEIFRAAEPNFDGRESEENWLLRDRDITKFRRLTRGNAPNDYHETYMAGLKMLQEGILKAANSLRTTMATNGCLFVQELARTLGPALDLLAEKFLQSFIKASAATKHIFAQQGNVTVDTIIQYVSYNIRLMQHVSSAMQDKNKQTRSYATGWLRTLLNKTEGMRSHFESSGGLDIAERSIREGLDDADSKVKEGTRATYWEYARIWPDKANSMLASLEPKVRAALEKDSNNPSTAFSSSQPSFAASTSSRTSGARSALRDRIAADKQRAKNLPPRPVTAAANPTPGRTRSIPNLNARVQLPAALAGQNRVPSNLSTSSTTTDKSSMVAGPARSSAFMSGAARRPVKRPELTRPATADPYASRRLARLDTMVDTSPAPSPRLDSAMRSSVIRDSAQRSVSPATADRIRPRSHHEGVDVSDSPNASMLGNMTFVIPNAMSHDPDNVNAQRRRMDVDESRSADSGVHIPPEENGSSVATPNVPRIPSAYRDTASSAKRNSARNMTEEVDTSTNRSSPSSVSRRQVSPAGTQRRSPSPNVRSPTPRSAGASRRASPTGVSGKSEIVRKGSPLKMVTAPSPAIGSLEEDVVKVYEDPFSSQPAAAISKETVMAHQPLQVLNDIPVNEPSQRLSNIGQRPDSPPASLNGASPSANGADQAMTSPDLGQSSPPLSPQSKAERLRARKLLHSGIERLRARTLDGHGFRKVHELIRSNEPLDLFGSESNRFDDLMFALCEYVARSNEVAHTVTPAGANGQKSSVCNNGSRQDLRRQALDLLKSMLTSGQSVYRKWLKAGLWHARTLSAALEARVVIDGLGLLVRDVEAVAQESLQGNMVGRDDIIESITDFLDRHLDKNELVDGQLEIGHEPSKDPGGRPLAQATALALRMLTLTVLGSAAAGPDDKGQASAPLTINQQSRVMTIVSSRLLARDAEVRKADVELATAVFKKWRTDESTHNRLTNGNDSAAHVDVLLPESGDEQKSGFWTTLESAPGGLAEGSRNLILYYIARNKGGNLAAAEAA